MSRAILGAFFFNVLVSAAPPSGPLNQSSPPRVLDGHERPLLREGGAAPPDVRLGADLIHILRQATP
eukprot:4620049-Pyramimonas_sp.AAC.1